MGPSGVSAVCSCLEMCVQFLHEPLSVILQSLECRLGLQPGNLGGHFTASAESCTSALHFDAQPPLLPNQFIIHIILPKCCRASACNVCTVHWHHIWQQPHQSWPLIPAPIPSCVTPFISMEPHSSCSRWVVFAGQGLNVTAS